MVSLYGGGAGGAAAARVRPAKGAGPSRPLRIGVGWDGESAGPFGQNMLTRNISSRLVFLMVAIFSSIVPRIPTIISST